MSPDAQKSRDRLIARLVKQVRELADGDEAELAAELVNQYYRTVALEDLEERRVKDLAGAVVSHVRFGGQRTPGEPLVRTLNPNTRRDGFRSTHTVVHLVNDDMPFLVDSMSIAMAKHGFTIHLTIHPVVRVRRDDDGRLIEVLPRGVEAEDTLVESFMHIEIDRETDRKLLGELETSIREALHDVRASVEDWQAMRRKTLDICDQLMVAGPPLPNQELMEGKAFLEWMELGHFTYLGYREYQLIEEDGKHLLRAVPNSGLGILRNPEAQSASQEIPEAVVERALQRELLVVTKANSVATVHRPGYMDYVGVKVYDEDGNVVGERRFLGLFTSVAYSRSPRDIPLLRHKVATVMQNSGLVPSSHAGKALLHILETFPRDELFQSSIDELQSIALGILALQERQRVKLFIRRDAFGRFYSCLVYVPRDRYNTQIRERIQNILMEALDGRSVESNVQLSESVLARVQITVRSTPWRQTDYDLDTIEDRITEVVRSWADVLKEALIDRHGEERGLKLTRLYSRAFPAAYVEDVSPKAAAFDVAKMVELGSDPNALALSLYRPSSFPERNLRFKLFRHEQPLPISDALPMLENMGLRVISEQPHRVELPDDSIIWIQDFEMVHRFEGGLVPDEVGENFQEAFRRVYDDDMENDGFNRLVLAANMDWRQIKLIRAIAKYLQQANLPFSQTYMEEAMSDNVDIAADLISLFETRFDPKLTVKKRNSQVVAIRDRIHERLDAVQSQDQDRILRGFLSVVMASLRTNHFQVDADGDPKPYLALKLDSSRIPELPRPLPMFEIWVYSPRVEAVHLRGGKVARGGLRWSDRREDFRTEVLGLMKAQMVKNSVIVPVGSKGGFVVKRPPRGDDRERLMAEVKACYRAFISGMLDITDNLDGDKVLPPKDVVRHDDDDPYLVVAADKGTATFSDLANSISQEYGFWLGDAFASGGSVGYDHKKMGITAKGAWESVKRHFREMGIDTQSREFTVAGIGDMAGDVFGNGMLLSPHIRLQAAFNHMHIFLDPDPDAGSSYAERQRLFQLPRSSWADYDSSLISTGGGIHPRSNKSIKLTRQVREMLGVTETEMSPQELIRAILKMRVDLIWNGGIGTYIKASSEAHSDVGDRTNDALRVNARDVQARVVGEGGNLGLTQLGRIEYALDGGRCNTDFIDNAGGVDCSDREVNIKILLNVVRANKRFGEKAREKLLAEMTDEVTELVLRDNYLQTQALSMMEAQASDRTNEYAHLISSLERKGHLDRGIEYLPTEEEIADRSQDGKSLSRPELSVILSYAKINLYTKLLDSDVAEDSYLQEELVRYFPTPLQKRYEELMDQHRLKREIVVTAITNSIINRMGPTFPYRMLEETSAPVSSVARAYTIAREAFDMRDLWLEIEALDNLVPASIQYSMMVQTSRLLKHATRWLLGRPGRKLDIAEMVERYQPGLRELSECLPEHLSDDEHRRFDETCTQFTDIGVPAGTAIRIAKLNTLYAGLDVVDVAAEAKVGVSHVLNTYFELADALSLDWIRDQIEHLKVRGHWQAVARGTLRENLYALHRQIAAQVLRSYRKAGPGEAVERWLSDQGELVQHAQQSLEDMNRQQRLDFATISVALQEIRKLTLI